MGFLDKVKNMFIEEVEEEEPVKKEVRQVEITKPAPPVAPQRTQTAVRPTQNNERPPQRPQVKPIEKLEVPNQPVKKEEKFVFPVYFDDKDFAAIEKKQPPIKRPQPSPERRQIAQPKKESYSGKQVEKVEKKVFKPTPIISPVYGILDKNYNKEDITVKKPVSIVEYRETRMNTIDSIRKKAYGTLEDELENTLFGKSSILLKDEEPVDELDLFQALEEEDVDVLVSDETPRRTRYKEENDKEIEPVNGDYNETVEDNLNDSDLFNLIDSMYDKKGDEK